jgi:hypothetical protein
MPMRFRVAALTCAATLMSIVPRLSMAQYRAHVVAGGGIGTDTRGVRSSVLTVAPSVIFSSHDQSWLRMGASFSRFAEGVSTTSGSLGIGGRQAAGPSLLSISASGSATRASYGATFLAAEIFPAAEVPAGAFSFGAGVRAAAASSSVPVIAGGALGGIRQGQADTSRSLTSIVGFASVRGMSDGTVLTATLREERGSASGRSVADHGVGVGATAREVALSASAGLRSVGGESSAYGSATVLFGLTGPLGLQLSAARQADDVLTRIPGGTFASASLVARLGGRTSAPSVPAVRDVAPVAAGHTRLTLRAPRANRVTVYGDWNGWKPVAAVKAPNGVWYADVRLPPGTYRYSFRVDESRWAVPEGVVSEDDGLGGRTAVITVPEGRGSVPAR